MAEGFRNWKFVIYEDSAPENWLEILEDVGVPCCVSPIHDRDCYKSDGEGHKKGDLEKPHRHVHVTLSGARPYEKVLEWFKPLGVNILKQGKDPRRDQRYLCHLDSPTKVKYDIAGLIPLNGYELKYLGERDQIPFISQIHKIIEEEGIIYFADLGHTISQQYPELQLTLIRYNSYFNNYCYSRERLTHRIQPVYEFNEETGEVIRTLMSSYSRSRVKIGE